MLNRNSFINYILRVLSIFIGLSLYPMQKDEVFVETTNSCKYINSLKYLAGKKILDHYKNLNTEQPLEIVFKKISIGELIDFLEKIRAIESIDMPYNLKQSFINIISSHSLNDILSALDVINTLESYCEKDTHDNLVIENEYSDQEEYEEEINLLTKDELKLLKEDLHSCNQVMFNLNPTLYLIERLSSFNWSFFVIFHDKVLKLKNYYLATLKQDKDNYSAYYLLIKICLFFKDFDLLSNLFSNFDIDGTRFTNIRSVYNILPDSENAKNLLKLSIILYYIESNIEYTKDPIDWIKISEIIKEFVKTDITLLNLVADLIFRTTELYACFSQIELESFINLYEKHLLDSENQLDLYQSQDSTLRLRCLCMLKSSNRIDKNFLIEKFKEYKKLEDRVSMFYLEEIVYILNRLYLSEEKITLPVEIENITNNVRELFSDIYDKSLVKENSMNHI
ncbi:hypothetical protein BABL1_gene_839 [Candidatus Babela massiliensis]|uniref:Uncharacterized protein n=2 Tax=Candidatus Babela massiliensis TaxID=673862 RepID=V6DEY9_9BACT|nr:hypothetical protein BABL1_gene_839 [Candidatus Babela massiliensis]